jgi:hypothetical protein
MGREPVGVGADVRGGEVVTLSPLYAQPATDEHYDRVVHRSDPWGGTLSSGGRMVFLFLRGVLAPSVIARARAFMGIDTAEPPSLSRRGAAGLTSVDALRSVFPHIASIAPVSPTSARVVVEDDRTLAQVVSNPVRSYLAGFTVSRYGNRAQPAKITKRYPRTWADALPFFQAIDETLQRYCTPAWLRMRERVACHPAWAIPGTALSTVTINVNYESRFHRDAGDFVDGYSALTVLERGAYTGGLFVLPEHRVAIDVREGDVLLVQSHVDWHGNTPIVGDGKRLSFVCYLKHGLAGRAR